MGKHKHASAPFWRTLLNMRKCTTKNEPPKQVRKYRVFRPIGGVFSSKRVCTSVFFLRVSFFIQSTSCLAGGERKSVCNLTRYYAGFFIFFSLLLSSSLFYLFFSFLLVSSFFIFLSLFIFIFISSLYPSLSFSLFLILLLLLLLSLLFVCTQKRN